MPDARDISIIDALPIYNADAMTILNIGDCDASCLTPKGHTVYTATDPLNPESFPISSADVVICSELLETIVNWKEALVNLIEATNKRLIICIPWRRSFHQDDHVNHWWENAENDDYLDIHEFEELAMPRSTSISKIRSKARDVDMGQSCYLIIVDKRQKWQE